MSAVDEEAHFPIYALTLWQPWASAIIDGTKRVENRPWAPPKDVVGQRIWIHAGNHYDDDRAGQVFRIWPEGGDFVYPRGAIIGSALIAGYAFEPEQAEIEHVPFQDDPMLDLFEDDDEVEAGCHTFGFAPTDIFDDPWWMGPYGWWLADIRKLDRPVECRGFQKLWRPKSETVSALRQLSKGGPVR